MRSIRIVSMLCALAIAPLFAQSTMREGSWEIKAQMEMPGMPMKMPETTMTQCITPEQAKSPSSALPGPSGKPNDSSCKATDQKIDGNTVTWKMSCSAPQSMTGEGRIVFSGDSYTGTMTMTTQQGTMNMKYSGKRLGDCKK